MRRSSLRLVVSILLAMSLSTTTWASGNGSPFSYCQYNAEPQREHRPSNIVRAEERLEEAENELERIEEEWENADECNGCAPIVEAALVASVGEENVGEYLEYLRGAPHCYAVANSAVSYYNFYASAMGWERIPQINDTDVYQPKRMVAEEGADSPYTGPDIEPPTGAPAPAPAPPQRNREDDELGGGGGAPVVTGVPARPAPQQQQCQFKGPEGTLDVQICEIAARAGAFRRRTDISRCRTCLGPVNRYGKCLVDQERLELALIEAEELVAQREDELSEARANPSSGTTCVDCQTDNRSWWERWGPMALVGGVTAVTGYMAYRQERDSYEYYRDVIHEDNNAKGYPTEPRMDTSGYTFANHMVNGLPMIMNTGLSTGAFGCAGSTVYGAGMVQGGPFAGGQIGGANGYPAGMLGPGGQVGASGNVAGILNGTLGGPGAHMGAQFGMNGGGQMNPGQLSAMIQQQNAMAQQAQARAQALQQQQSYYQSVYAIQQDAQSRVQALGNGVFQGGVNITGGFDVFGQAQGGVPYQQYPTSFNPGVPNGQNMPPGGNVQNPGVPPNTQPPATIGL